MITSISLCFVCVFKCRMQPAFSRTRFRRSEYDDIGKAERFRNVGEARARYECHFNSGEPAFVKIVESLESLCSDDGAQDAVAEELEALVRIANRFSFGCRWMGYR